MGKRIWREEGDSPGLTFEASRLLDKLDSLKPPQAVRDFLILLQRRLPDRYTPGDFINVWLWLQTDMARGHDEEGTPIQHPLVGQPPRVYAAFTVAMPALAANLVGQELGVELSRLFDEVCKD
jgi:hypothetical protein